MKKLKDFYMPTETLESALDACDLGDSHTAYVIQYPHRDDFDKITHVREVVPIDWGTIWKKIFDDEIGYIPNKEERMQIQQLVEEQIKGEG